VNIYVDQKLCCQSDKNGFFKLTKIRPTGNVKIRAEFDGYIFKNITYSINLNKIISLSTSSKPFLIITPEK